MQVRRRPDLWLWMHRRWRDAPAPETHGMFPKARDEEDTDEIKAEGRRQKAETQKAENHGDA
jgi:lauroyl/myristoyl acyltransferase